MTQGTMITVSTLAELKALNPTNGQSVFMLGRTVEGDGFAGTYRWATGDATAADDTYLNVVASTVNGFLTTGRWLRNLVRAQPLPQGVLVANGGVKTLYAAGVTVSGGTVVLRLTMDNTTTGTPIFTEVWMADAASTLAAATPALAVAAYERARAADLRSITYAFTRLNGLAAADAGIPVRVRVEGI